MGPLPTTFKPDGGCKGTPDSSVMVTDRETRIGARVRSRIEELQCILTKLRLLCTHVIQQYCHQPLLQSNPFAGKLK